MQIKNWNWSITGKTIRSKGDVHYVRAADPPKAHIAVELQGRSLDEFKVRATAVSVDSNSIQRHLNWMLLVCWATLPPFVLL